MIPQQKEREGVFLSSNDDQSNFGMNVSAEAFKILSSQIYQHKIPAVIREYACNAADAHIEAGKEDVPFIISLPTDLSPVIEFQDFGVGLDDHGVRSVFSTYFGSTKKQSAKATGYLGLGSKSAYSYTDSFRITAVKDGVQRDYLAFFDSNDMPCLNKMSEVEVSHPNGVTISFDVNRYDINRFREDTSFIASFLKVKPTIIGGQIWNDTIADELKEKGWVTVGDAIPNVGSLYNTGFDSIGIVMGGVVYSLTNHEVSDILRKFECDSLYPEFIRSLRTRLFVEVEMGSVEFAASRETLSMTESTKRVVKDSVCKTVDEIIASVKEEVDACSHIVEAYDHTKKVLGFIPSTLKWKNTPVRRAQQSTTAFLEKVGIRTAMLRYSSCTSMVDTDLKYLYKNCILVVRDVKRTGIIKHTKATMRHEGINKPVLICTKQMRDKHIEKIKSIYAPVEVIKASDIMPKQQKKAVRRADDTEIRGVWRDFTVPKTHPSSPMETEGYYAAYAVREGSKDMTARIVDDEGRSRNINIETGHSTDLFRSLGIDRIIYMNGSNEKKIKRLGLPNITDVVLEEIKNNRSEINDWLANLAVRSELKTDTINTYFFLKEIEAQAIDEMGIIAEEERMMKESRLPSAKAPAIYTLGKFCTINQDRRHELILEAKDINDKVRNVMVNRYPLIAYRGDLAGDMASQSVVEYIHAMDLYREAQLINEM